MKLYNLQAESALISSILRRHAAIHKANKIILPDDIYHPDLRALYNVLNDIKSKPNETVDLVIFLTEIEKHGYNIKREFVFELFDNINTSAATEAYATEIKAYSKKRQLLKIASDIQDQLSDLSDPDEILSNVKQDIINVGSLSGDKILSSKDAVNQAFSELEKIHQAGSKLIGLLTGFERFDLNTGGLKPGQLIIIAGRPASGKSVLASNIASAVNVPVGYINLEMTPTEIMLRRLSGQSMIDYTRVQNAHLRDGEWSEMLQAAETISSEQINYVDNYKLTIDRIVSLAENMKIEKGIGLLVIDYLQLITPRNKNNREQEVSDISRTLKNLALDLKMPIICLAQLNRKLEDRQDKRPMLSDLRESGAIEQDADIVIGIYRDAMYQADQTVVDHSAEILVLKARGARTGRIRAEFWGEYQKFIDIKEV